ncbi:MAG: cobalt transporter CbiM [Pseudomonadota bacterium]
MHISEGVLSAPALFAGAVLAVGGTVIGLKKLDIHNIPQAGILSAAFFVASLIHIPIGPSSIHLILNGMVGFFLGWVAFPAILTALVLQAIMFQFGGITTLGVNTIIMAGPAVLCYYIFSPFIQKKPWICIAASFACGSTAVFLGALLLASFLVFSDKHFLEISMVVVIAHLPVMVIEGLITTFCVLFLRKVRPSILPGYLSGSG